jgi:hypothetical protein
MRKPWGIGGGANPHVHCVVPAGGLLMFEFLIPGVKPTEEADLRAEMLGIASDFEEGCGTGLQQEMVGSAR